MSDSTKPASHSFKVNDRVKKVSGDGCFGVVAEIRYETTGRDESSKNRNPIIAVTWDNGTQTVVGARGIVPAK